MSDVAAMYRSTQWCGVPEVPRRDGSLPAARAEVFGDVVRYFTP